MLLKVDASTTRSMASSVSSFPRKAPIFTTSPLRSCQNGSGPVSWNLIFCFYQIKTDEVMKNFQTFNMSSNWTKWMLSCSRAATYCFTWENQDPMNSAPEECRWITEKDGCEEEQWIMGAHVCHPWTVERTCQSFQENPSEPNCGQNDRGTPGHLWGSSKRTPPKAKRSLQRRLLWSGIYLIIFWGSCKYHLDLLVFDSARQQTQKQMCVYDSRVFPLSKRVISSSPFQIGNLSPVGDVFSPSGVGLLHDLGQNLLHPHCAYKQTEKMSFLAVNWPGFRCQCKSDLIWGRLWWRRQRDGSQSPAEHRCPWVVICLWSGSSSLCSWTCLSWSCPETPWML